MLYFIVSKGLKAFIGSERKRISFENLAVPPFLRFDDVLLEFRSGSRSLLEKCLVFEDCLNSIKPALKDSNRTCFDAIIDSGDPCHFSDHSTIVIYLRYGLLPICNSSRRYNFDIDFDLNENCATDLISSILQISQVRLCSNVSIELFDDFDQSTRLPVEDISNWLAPKTDNDVAICGKKAQYRFLKIYLDIISNGQKMWEHLKAVNFFPNKLIVKLSNNNVATLLLFTFVSIE